MIVKLQGEQNPIVDIFVNNKIYKQDMSIQEDDQIQIDNKKFSLRIVLKNKTTKDTVVIDDKIVQDKFVKIKGLIFGILDLKEQEFLNMYDPMVTHNSESFKSNYLGFNDPSYLECVIQHPHLILLKNVINAGSPIDYDQI